MNAKILESIAEVIESRPVLGHWPHMRAGADADYLRGVAAELAVANEGWLAADKLKLEAQNKVSALEAELAAEKMQHSVTIAEEHESRTAFQDGIRAIEAELIGEMKLRQTAEAYAARNALRVIAVEAALREAHDAMVDISVQSSMSAVHRMASTSISKTYAALGITHAETASVKPKCSACEDSGWLLDVNRKVPCDVCEAGPAWLHAQGKIVAREMNKCIWEREEKSDRGWFVANEHSNEDSEHPSVQHVWSYCPYCGKELEFKNG